MARGLAAVNGVLPATCGERSSGRRRVERNAGEDHLEEEHAERPPVDGRGGAAVLGDRLRRHVLERPREGPLLALGVRAEPREPVVGEVAVALAVEQDVGRLDVAMQYAALLEVVDRQRELARDLRRRVVFEVRRLSGRRRRPRRSARRPASAGPRA